MLKVSTKAPAAGTRPEVELLLCCARTCMDTSRAERLRNLLQEEIDWEYILRTARSQGVMPLLYTSLKTTCPEAVPESRLAQLRDYFRANARHNLCLTAELLKLLNLFETHEVPAIPFKGPVLAASVYGDLGLRQFGDLDILVHERDFLKAKNLLISQGYRLQLELGWEHHYVHEDSKVCVDLHQRILPREWPFPLDFERLCGRLEPVFLAGTTVLKPLPEDLLLILCVQLAKDCWQGWEPLSKICDIAALLCVHQEINWGRVMEQAGKLGSKRMLLLGLFLASTLLETALPEEIWQRIQATPVVKALAMQVCSRLFREADCPPKNLEKHLFYFRMRERLQDKVPYLLDAILPLIPPSATDRAFLPLPAFLSFLYYLVRPIRVVGKYGLSPLKRRLGF